MTISDMESTEDIAKRILSKLTLSGHFKTSQHRKNYKNKINKRVQV